MVSWLASWTHYGEGGQGGGQGGWRRERKRGVAPLEVVDKFLDIQMDTEDSESLPYFQQRSTMIVNIVRRMRQEEGEGWWWARWLSWDRQTQSHGDDIDLTIPGTKQVARLKIPPCLDLYGSYGAHADHDHTGDHVPAPCRSSSAPV